MPYFKLQSMEVLIGSHTPRQISECFVWYPWVPAEALPSTSNPGAATMSYMDKKIQITADLAKVKAAAANLKSNANAAQDLQRDPKAYLAQVGIEIDSNTADLIKDRLAGQKSTAAPASVIHIDV
jgi:hypothetical protein